MPTGIYVRTEEHRKRVSKTLKGRKFSEERKRKMSEAQKGKKMPPISKEHRKKLSEALKGKKRPPFSKEWKRNMGKAQKGKKVPPLTKKHRRNISEALKGLHPSEETRKKLSETKKGEKCHFWQGGISPINERIRKSIEGRLWREAVFARDNWICQKCEERGGKLHPHHIFNFSTCLDLRFAIDNGITFCKKCHREFHKKYGVKNNTKEQLEEFLKQK